VKQTIQAKPLVLSSISLAIHLCSQSHKLIDAHAIQGPVVVVSSASIGESLHYAHHCRSGMMQTWARERKIGRVAELVMAL